MEMRFLRGGIFTLPLDSKRAAVAPSLQPEGWREGEGAELLENEDVNTHDLMSSALEGGEDEETNVIDEEDEDDKSRWCESFDGKGVPEGSDEE
ncbi:hypothetical protein HAX54_041182 [Datura stramonium]|uniref:Uncharacterized protein n=1 Tax=Datura stramonium TaxID=4076 RepID=A0ABS8VTU4_DATST|nr:hypothetical protein [Datura stramonium]